jgi:hypothetical protein
LLRGYVVGRTLQMLLRRFHHFATPLFSICLFASFHAFTSRHAIIYFVRRPALSTQTMRDVTPTRVANALSAGRKEGALCHKGRAIAACRINRYARLTPASLTENR